jgi:hypothetical protein
MRGWTCPECGRRQRWTALSFYLRRPASHRTIVRKVVRDGQRYLRVANVAEPARRPR